MKDLLKKVVDESFMIDILFKTTILVTISCLIGSTTDKMELMSAEKINTMIAQRRILVKYLRGIAISLIAFLVGEQFQMKWFSIIGVVMAIVWHIYIATLFQKVGDL